MSQEAANQVNEAWNNGWPKVVARAWSDPAYRARLMADPHAVIADAGLPHLEGVDITVVEGSANPTMTLSLPPAPEGSEGTQVEAGGELSSTETSCCC